MPENKGGNDNNNDDGDDAGVSGHEMAGLTCLLPQKDGKLGQGKKLMDRALLVYLFVCCLHTRYSNQGVCTSIDRQPGR